MPLLRVFFVPLHPDYDELATRVFFVPLHPDYDELATTDIEQASWSGASSS